jgi:magnesium transporter
MQSVTVPSDAVDPRNESGTGDRTRLRIRRFDADRLDTTLSLDEALSARLTKRQLLWIDITGDLDTTEGRAIAERFELDSAADRALERPGAYPHLAMHGTYFHIRLMAEPDIHRPERINWLDVIAAENAVITRHAEPVVALGDKDERIAGDTPIGQLNAGMFVASVLDAVVTTYFHAADAIEDEVDELDAQSLRQGSQGGTLSGLVALRRRIARLRRALANHREVFSSLTNPDFVLATDNPDAASTFKAVSDRFESALAAVEDSRDVLLGSFDVFMTRTAQRTNDTMKVLALATVLLLPGSLIAGLMGMNVAVPVSNTDPTAFWVIVGLIVLLGGGVLVFARARRWL